MVCPAVNKRKWLNLSKCKDQINSVRNVKCMQFSERIFTLLSSMTDDEKQASPQNQPGYLLLLHVKKNIGLYNFNKCIKIHPASMM